MKLASKSQKVELNHTNLELKSKNTRSDCAKMPNRSHLKASNREKLLSVLLKFESLFDGTLGD
jgi:hypothetical protein